MNKIKCGLKNVHYAKITEQSDGSITYAAPKRIPGAVSISLKGKTETTKIAADDDPSYYIAEDNQGYEGDLEIQIVPDHFKKDILGFTEDSQGVLTENKDAETENFALMFEFAGDKKKIRHLMYNCHATKPDIESSTKGDKVESQTDKLALTCSPAKDTGNVKSRVMEGQAPYANWYSAVYNGTAGVQISPNDVVFDKKTANQNDIIINIIPSASETLSKITNGDTTLTTTTHYTNSSNVVTLKKAYLATLPVGVTELVFTFSDNSTRTLEVTVINS